MAELPTGTVTFLFTDIEGSTRLWEEQPEAMRAALARHEALLHEAIEAHEGYVFEQAGDGFCVAFARATDALAAALDAQRALQAEPWGALTPLKVRMALYTGEAEERDGDYFGPPLNRCARILAAGHGGQIILSRTAADLVRGALPPGVELRALGEHRLRDLAQPEDISQLLHPDLPFDFPPLRSLAAFTHNLPVQLTSFIGREKEVEEIKRLLTTTRLLTLTGTGGAGKTRLALQVGADLLDECPDGVWLVELASVADPSLVPQTILSALGLREEPQRALTDTLIDSLRPKHALLILDNCEHLVEACARLAADLLRRCPEVAVIATSREVLQAEGETVWRVPSLGLPDREAPQPPISVLTQYEAVRLFIERAVAAKPDFRVTNGNAPAVAEICWRLDGMPLAVELAAARVNVLPPEEIERRLDDRFRLLTGGRRTALPRHQTLQAAVEWSYSLLPEPERRLFARLSVFAGSFSLAGAQALRADEGLQEWEILDLLTALVERSLVVPEPTADVARYRLLETLRAYGWERLSGQGEAETASRRHAEHFMAFAQEAKAKLRGPEQADWFARVQADYGNLRAALAWGLREDVEAAARLASALPRFWEVRGYWREGRQWLEGCLAGGRDLTLELKANTLLAAGRLAWCQCDYGRAEALYEQCRELPRESEHRREYANALLGLGNVAARRADWSRAKALYEESLALQRESGDQPGIATTLNNLGWVGVGRGEYDAARALFGEALAIRRELGDEFEMAQTLTNLGDAACMQGEYATARGFHGEALRIRRGLGEKCGIAFSLHGLGWAAHEQGEHQAALALYEESLKVTRELGARGPTAFTLNNLGNLTRTMGDHVRARAMLEEAVAVQRELGHAQGLALSLSNLGALLSDQGDYGAARVVCEEGLAVNRETGDRRGLCWSLGALADVDLAEGDLGDARAAYGESACVARDIGDRLAAAVALEGLARVAIGSERHALATRLFGAADALREALGSPLPPDGRQACDRNLAGVRADLGNEDFGAAWTRGRAMTLDEAIREALGDDDGS